MDSAKNMTLEDRSLVSVALAIWNSSPKTVGQLLDFNNSTSCCPFQRICYRNIETLELPELTKERLKVLIEYIGIEVSYLLSYYAMIFTEEEKILYLLSCSRLTAQGVLDIGKTTRTLLKMDSISLKDRYKLACNLCFHVEVAELWEGLTEDERSSLIQIPDEQGEYLDLVTIWSLVNANKNSKLMQFASKGLECDEYLFYCAVASGCVEAVHYFYKDYLYTALGEAIYVNDAHILMKEELMWGDADYSPLIGYKRIAKYLKLRDNRELPPPDLC